MIKKMFQIHKHKPDFFSIDKMYQPLKLKELEQMQQIRIQTNRQILLILIILICVLFFILFSIFRSCLNHCIVLWRPT